jgi:hypothetical protein
MVGDHDNFLGVKYFFHANLAKFGDGDGRSDVITENNINLTIDKFAGNDGLFTAMRGQYFF